MTDKTLLQAARDALANVVQNYEYDPVTCLENREPGNPCLQCDSIRGASEMITSLDAELAKVAEPVDEEREIVVLRSVIGSRKDMGMTSDAIARAVWQAGYRLPGQPVVLDLSGMVYRNADGLAAWSPNETIAAIRAQLPGVSVKC